MPSAEQNGSSDGVRVFRAPDRERVIAELRRWVAAQRQARPELVRVGLFGSYATGRHAPGSDIDLLVLVRHSNECHWFLRAAGFDTATLPVGVDLFVYTEAEADRMRRTSRWFQHVLRHVLWIDADPNKETTR